MVTVTRGGYLKRTSLDTYRRQSRGGKGRIGMATRSEDVVEHLMVANTHSYLLIFTSMGRLYWLKVYNIPDAAAATKGKNINGLISLQPDETVRAFLSVKEFTPDTLHRDGHHATASSRSASSPSSTTRWPAASSPSASTTTTS